MALVQQNFPAYLRTLRIIFVALVIAQIAATVVLYGVRLQEAPTAATVPTSGAFQFLPALLLVLVAASFFLYRKNLAAARMQADLKGKLRAYRLALLLRWVPLEVATLLIGVFYFLTGITPFLYAALLLIMLFVVSQWPYRDRLVTALDLSSDEQSILDDPNEIVSEISQRPG